MRKKGSVFLLGLIVILCGWWMLGRGSRNQPEEGVLDVWTTWAEGAGQLQALLSHYDQASGLPVRVAAGIKSGKLSRAMASSAPPDVVVLSSSDLVASYDARDLVEPLDPWIEVTGIDLDDMYPAPLAQCKAPDGAHLCLPWSCDIDALFWNKDLFQAAGLDPERPPQTMEELVEYAGKLTVRDEEGELGQVGFVPDLVRSHMDLYVQMFGGSWYDDGELAARSQPVIDALDWQSQFYGRYGREDVQALVSSFDRYTSSHHPVYAGKRLDCQQCHRGTPPGNGIKIPDQGFYTGKVTMMVGGAWQVGPGYISQLRPELNYGVAPFPPPADHAERANTAVVRSAVVLIPAGAKDKEAAAELVAWMMSPEIVADAAYASAVLPTSRTAALDARFQQDPHLQVFMGLLDDRNARYVASTPISAELNEALRQVEEKLLHEGSDPVPLLDEIQSGLGPKLEGGLAYNQGP
ncbi:MAG: extracellular solute-binding protein [Anaerolineae bacterium]